MYNKVLLLYKLKYNFFNLITTRADGMEIDLMTTGVLSALFSSVIFGG